MQESRVLLFHFILLYNLRKTGLAFVVSPTPFSVFFPRVTGGFYFRCNVIEKEKTEFVDMLWIYRFVDNKAYPMRGSRPSGRGVHFSGKVNRKAPGVPPLDPLLLP